MKKIYTKPEAELVKFYSEEEVLNTEDPNISGDMKATDFSDLGFDWT